MEYDEVITTKEEVELVMQTAAKLMADSCNYVENDRILAINALSLAFISLAKKECMTLELLKNHIETLFTGTTPVGN